MSSPRLQLEIEIFLARHWQREHLFIPGGMAPFQPPADADALAGLALEAEADSRIVYETAGHWQQERGPFDEAAFRRPGSWTLLVQSVDSFWDAAADLRRAVKFLPDWRLEDVMMSYASDGGSAGPHYDNYDVFIIQGEGQRRWQVGGFCDEESTLLEDTDLRLLADFEPEHEYLMQSGDVLYLPPGRAHYGVSVGESTSFSIGFRAPRISDLMARWLDNRLARLDDDWLFRDPGREPATRSGEISDHDLLRARQQLMAALDDDDPRWFGEAVTATAPMEDSAAPAHLDQDSSGWLCRVPGSRLAWMQREGELLLFAQGVSRGAPLTMRPLIEALCSGSEVDIRETRSVHDGTLEVLNWLLDEGTIEIHD